MIDLEKLDTSGLQRAKMIIDIQKMQAEMQNNAEHNKAIIAKIYDSIEQGKKDFEESQRQWKKQQQRWEIEQKAEEERREIEKQRWEAEQKANQERWETERREAKERYESERKKREIETIKLEKETKLYPWLTLATVLLSSLGAALIAKFF